MPTPAKGYFTKAGVRVPSVTTVISRFKDSGGLLYWANHLAYDPYRELRAIAERIVAVGMVDPATINDLKALISKPADSYDYKVARDTAAGIGTIVHARIDAHIRGVPFEPDQYRNAEFPDPLNASELGFAAFKTWAGSTQFRLAEGEIQLVSDKYGYGGTPDVVMVNGESCVGDWKTGDLYPEQLMPQLAGYRQLLREGGRPIGSGGHAVSVNKKTGGFTHRYFTPSEMDLGWQAFVRMRELYQLVKELK